MNKKMWAAPALDELDVSLTFGGMTGEKYEGGGWVNGQFLTCNKDVGGFGHVHASNIDLDDENDKYHTCFS